jgi:pimeloyl-ACP methyl ester carboxylesterase
VPLRPGRRLRVLLTSAVLTAGLVGCTASVVDGQGSAGSGTTAPPTSSAGQSTGPAPATAKFGSCDGIDLGSSDAGSRFETQCARISVPLDYADPTGKQIEVALVRLHRRGASPKASLLGDPGGPGGSGVQFAVQVAGALPSSVTERYDLVGFDPRGVGSSTPVECISDKEKDALNAAQPDVTTAAGFAEAKRLAKDVAQACSAKYGNTLDDFGTVATAKDMDRIRQALGDKQLNYLGFSYGTELGGQYAHLFPGKVGAMVLDGAVNPLTDDITSFANQLDGFEKAFDQFATWCGEHSPCDSLGNPRQAVYELAAKARTSPLHSSAPGETRVATSSIVDLGVLSALYSKSLWEGLGQSLVLARQGDARGLLQLADLYNERDAEGHYTNISDSNLTIGCNDSKPGPSDATIRATAAAWVKRFPMFGEWSAASLFACQPWQPKRTVPPKPTAPTSAHVILVVGNLHDPATPYQGAKDLAATLGKARLLTWDGEGHTSFLQGSSCIDDAVTAYLTDGTVPADGKTCPR